MLYDEGGEALAQVAQSSCGCPIPGNVRGQAGRGSAQPELAEVSLSLAGGSAVVHGGLQLRAVGAETLCRGACWHAPTARRGLFLFSLYVLGSQELHPLPLPPYPLGQKLSPGQAPADEGSLRTGGLPLAVLSLAVDEHGTDPSSPRCQQLTRSPCVLSPRLQGERLWVKMPGGKNGDFIL